MTCSRSTHCTGNTSPLAHTPGTLSIHEPQDMVFAHFCFILLRKGDATVDLFLLNLRQIPMFSLARSTAPPPLTHKAARSGEPPPYRGVHCSAALFTTRAKKKKRHRQKSLAYRKISESENAINATMELSTGGGAVEMGVHGERCCGDGVHGGMAKGDVRQQFFQARDVQRCLLEKTETHYSPCKTMSPRKPNSYFTEDKYCYHSTVIYYAYFRSRASLHTGKSNA